MDTDLIAFESLITAQQSLAVAQETAKWNYLMMFATWFAFGATFLAVVVSLYLANRKPISKISASAYTSIMSISPGVSAMGLSINIANVGDRPVVINSITWMCGGKYTLHLLFCPGVSEPLPKKLEHGESATFFHEFKDFSSWQVTMLDYIKKSSGELKKLRYVVSLGTGKEITFNLPKELIETLGKTGTG